MNSNPDLQWDGSVLGEDPEAKKEDAEKGFKMKLQQIGYEKIPSPNEKRNNFTKLHSTQKETTGVDMRKISHESSELKAQSQLASKMPPSLYLNDVISQNQLEMEKSEKRKNEDQYSSSDERRDRVSSLRESRAQIGAGLQQQNDPDVNRLRSLSDKSSPLSQESPKFRTSPK